MQNNYHFLRQLVPQIASKIVGLKLMECFSQDKDELIIGFAAARGVKNNYKEFFIKAVVFNDFACLFFPERFERARKNSTNLFEELFDKEVLSVQQFLNERCFAIHFEENYSLLFKLYGNRSNIILYQNQEVIDIFNSQLIRDKEIEIQNLDRVLDQSFENFISQNQDYRKLFPTFGKIVTADLDKKLKTIANDAQTKWHTIDATKQQLDTPTYYITQIEHEYYFSLIPVGEIRQEFTDPIAAINAFYITYTKHNTIEKERNVVLRQLLKEKKQTDAYLEASYKRLEVFDNQVKNEEIGHILMANLHTIPERIEQVELFDFYRNQPIIVKLKADLSPQKNAEHYYRKSKNEKLEIDNILENIENREKLLAEINQHITALQAIEQVRELRNYLKINKLGKQVEVKELRQLFKEFICDGFVILVGKNSRNNDLLTQQYAFKEDLWLHAREAQGSHVIVKYQAGKNFPKNVIERAASLAAYYSKLKNESLAPVILTKKKYVRKPKGLPDGQVVVDKEELVMIEPKG